MQTQFFQNFIKLFVFTTIIIFSQITDYSDLYKQCTIHDQNLLSIFHVDSGAYRRHKCGYRKRTAPVKLLVKKPLAEECIQVIVRIYYPLRDLYFLQLKENYSFKHIFYTFITLLLLLFCRKINLEKSDFRNILTILLNRQALIGNIVMFF